MSFSLAASLVLAFAASSIDDFVLLVCLYADRSASVREISGAKLLCALLTLGAAIVCAMACLALPVAVSRMVGLIPLALGVKRLIDRRSAQQDAARDRPDPLAGAQRWRGAGRFAGYTAILGAASFDNVALYIPLFVQGQRAAWALGFGIILPLTALLCALALWVSRVRFTQPARWLKLDAAVPYLMMLVGIKSLAAALT